MLISECQGALYTYKATCRRVVAGDTLDVDIDLGLSVHTQTRIRLFGINTSEIHAKDLAERERAHQASERVKSLVWDSVKNASFPLLLQTQKDQTEKYGRYLGIIWIPDGTGQVKSLNDLLVDEGLAVRATY